MQTREEKVKNTLAPGERCASCGAKARNRGYRILPEGEEARRAERLRPLFEYVERENIRMAALVARACMKQGVKPFRRSRIYMIKVGHCVTPEWFITAIVDELRRPIAEVMGAEWVAREEAICSAENGSRPVAG